MTEPVLLSNAWCGEAAQGELSASSLGWGAQRDLKRPAQMAAAPKPADPNDWRHPDIGWGVVLPDREDVPAADKARGLDAPPAIRRLIAERGNAPVLRYRSVAPSGFLRRHEHDGSQADLNLRGARGLAPKSVPRYLLIVGSPAAIPWELQYRLQTDAFVGRLDLDDAGLERYVDALLADWAGSPRDVKRPLVWAVDHGHPDITWLMRRGIADRLKVLLAADTELDMAGGFCSDAAATHAALANALAERRPAFVVSASHGATFPLGQLDAMRAQLGLPVDAAHAVAPLNDLATGWNARGAIWYAHACCSAGAHAGSRFAGLVGADSSLGRTLAGIGQLGACTAPLPRALLGGANPLGAFIGHVEPTFDWTLRDPVNGQLTTQHVVESLYGRLHAAERPTIGVAMEPYFRAVGGLLQDHANALDAIDEQAPEALPNARRARLLALDRLAMVILGDPTVRLPMPT